MAAGQRATPREFTAYEANLIGRFVRSSVGRKVVMSLSGVGLFGFVVVHMLGNLQLFFGPEPINHYAHLLKSNAEIIWPARYGLIACVVVHIVTSLSLWYENRQARDHRYSQYQPTGSSLASRTMLLTGTLFLAYVVYHLLHFTIGTVQPEYMKLVDAKGRHDVYRMMVLAFSDYRVSVLYVLGTGAICFHLSHGASAMFQSLGWKNHAYAERMTNVAKLVSFLIFLGYCAVPFAVLYGIVK